MKLKIKIKKNCEIENQINFFVKLKIISLTLQQLQMAYKWNLQDQLEFLRNESKHPVEVLIESNVFLGYHSSANNYKKLQRLILVSNKNIIIL